MEKAYANKMQETPEEKKFHLKTAIQVQKMQKISDSDGVVTMLKCPYTFTKRRKTQQRVKPVYFQTSEPCSVGATFP